MKAIKTAIFGTGFMGRVHLEAVRRVESVETAAVVGRNAQTTERLAAGFAIPKTTTDFREVLRDGSIDAVHICTPNAQHFSMAKVKKLNKKNRKMREKDHLISGFSFKYLTA